MSRRTVVAVLRDFGSEERARARRVCKAPVNGGKRFLRIERVDLADGTRCYVAVYSR